MSESSRLILNSLDDVIQAFYPALPNQQSFESTVVSIGKNYTKKEVTSFLGFRENSVAVMCSPSQGLISSEKDGSISGYEVIRYYF